MDLCHSISRLHGSPGAKPSYGEQYGSPVGGLRGSQNDADPARHITRDPVGAFRTVAAQAVRFEQNAISSAAYLASHPATAIVAATGALRHPINACQTVKETIFGSSVVERSEHAYSDDGSANDRLEASDVYGKAGVQTENEKLARRTRLQEDLRTATSWLNYEATARALGELQEDEEWKNEHSTDLYDVDRVLKRLTDLDRAHANDDLPAMLHLIRTQLTRNLGDITNPALFEQTQLGTKTLIERYIETVNEAVQRLVSACGHEDKRIDKHQVEAAFKEVRQAYGRTALLFSGGGTLGMIHIGVIKAFSEAKALPRIISGSSAGAIVCAVLCTKTDEEIPQVLHDFCHGDLAVFVGADEKEGWYGRLRYLIKHGNLFNVENLQRVMRNLLGDMTFLEAYNQTRRILNITVSSAEPYESRQVLNYSTAGDVCIWSAVVVSCALPFGYKPGQLISKDPRTKITEPWDAFTFHVDGSVEGDLPIDKVSAEFNVNHVIASQVNPHVVPFVESHTHFEGLTRRLGDIATSIAKDEGMHRLRNFAELPYLTNPMSKVYSVIGQQYTGDITILPKDTISYFFNVLSNPTPEFMEQAMQNGERATWPLLSMIKNHLEIELLIDKAVDKMKEHVSFSDSASDLRRMLLKRPSTSKRSGRHGGRPGSSGSHQTARSTIVPRPVENRRRADHRAVRSMLDKPTVAFDGPALKVAGDPVSPSSSRSGSVSINSSDESDREDDESNTSPSPPLQLVNPLPEPNLYQSATQPNSPSPVSKGFFDSPRSSSPAPLPVNLMMTPSSTSERPGSPELKHKQQLHGGLRPIPTVKSPPPMSRSSSRERSGMSRGMNMLGKRVDLQSMAKNMRRKRSSSTGNVPEP